jgi:hypothetical protein
MRISSQFFASRKQISSSPRSFDGSKTFRYALLSPDCRFNALCPQPNSSESTRGPPRRGPPIFC